MRTNIVIDNKLMEQAMLLSGLTTKKDVVDRALREFVRRRSQKDLRELRGKVQFADDYDHKALREGR